MCSQASVQLLSGKDGEPVFDADKLYLIKATSMKAGVNHLLYVPASSEMAHDTKGQTGRVSDRETQMRPEQKVWNELRETNIWLMKRRETDQSQASVRLERERKRKCE